jgi:5-methylcytosine-specific restriction endonuclease McrA
VANDLVQWAQVSPIGVGEVPGRAVDAALAYPGTPTNKPRSRPNRGRMKRSDRLKPQLKEPPWDLLRATGYPIPPNLTILGGDMPRYWRQGVRANAWRKAVFAMWGRECHLCKHQGADSADHLVPLAVWGNQPYDARISRPAHGVAGCPICKIKCNSSRGNRALAIEIGNYQPPIAM